MAGWRFYLNNTEVEEPIGWDSVEFTATRTDNHGIDQPFSSALTFYGLGAKILQAEFQSNFISGSVSIRIESDVLINGTAYEYNGIIDFSTYEEINTCDTDSWQISVGVLQDTFRDKFKARYDVEVDLYGDKDLDGNTIPLIAKPLIRMHAQRLNLLADGSSLSGANRRVEKDGLNWSRDEFATMLPVYWDNSDFQDQYGSTVNTTGPIYSNTNVNFTDNSGNNVIRNFTIRWNQFSLQYRFDYTTYLTIPQPLQSMNMVFTLNVFNSDGTDYAVHYLESGPVVFLADPLEWWVLNGGSFTFPVPANGRFSLYLQWGSDGNIDVGVTGQGMGSADFGAEVVLYDNIEITLTELNQGYASNCHAFPVEQWLRRIIYQITGVNNSLVSNCFSEADDGIYANNSITTGLLLRQYSPPVGERISVRTSFKKTFDSLAAIFGLGWAFEQQQNGTWKIRVEPYDYFYDSVVQLDVNHVEELKTTVASDKINTQLKLGFTDLWKNMALGGIDAISTDRVYFIDNKSIQNGTTKTQELKSDIIAEGIAIEYSRRLQFFDANAGSSDRPNDYSLFIIWTIRENTEIYLPSFPQYKYESQANSTETITLIKYRASWSSDLSNGFAARWGDNLRRYNLFHTATRVALRQWPLLGMNVYGVANPVWRFQVGQYNTGFTSAVNNLLQPWVIENTSNPPLTTALLPESTDIGSVIIRPEFQNYLMRPIIYEFTYPQSLCDFIQVANYTPYQRIRVSMGGVMVSGWILSIKNKPEDNAGGTTIFTIIAYNDVGSIPEMGAYSNAYSNAYD